MLRVKESNDDFMALSFFTDVKISHSPTENMWLKLWHTENWLLLTQIKMIFFESI